MDGNNIEIERLKTEIISLSHTFTSNRSEGVGGALAGFGAYSVATMLATASTRTAISTLSGVATTNATLAWFDAGGS